SGLEGLLKLALGSVFGHSTRIQTVTSARGFRKLTARMLQEQTLSFWSFITAGQAFNVKSSDDWWKMCFRMLMHSCEIVVVDLSKVQEGTAWELGELRRSGLFDKCVLTVGESHMDSLADTLKSYFGGSAQP